MMYTQEVLEYHTKASNLATYRSDHITKTIGALTNITGGAFYSDFGHVVHVILLIVYLCVCTC